MRILILTPVLEDIDERRVLLRKEAMKELSEAVAPDVELELRGLDRLTYI